MPTTTRQITARELIDWQIGLLGFWLSPEGQRFGYEFLKDEAEKWGTMKEVGHLPKLLARFMAEPLYTADPYYVTEEITDLIVQAAKLRNSMQYKLEMHQLPTPEGFMVFEKQIYMKDIRGLSVGIRAITWRAGEVSAAPDVGGIVDLGQHPSASGVEIAFYTDTYVPDVLEHDTSLAQSAKALEEKYGRSLEDGKWSVRGLTRFLLLSHKGMMFGEHDHLAQPEYADDLDVILRGEDQELDDEFAAKIYSGEIKMTADMAEHLKTKDYFFPHDLFVAAILVMNQKVAGIAGMPADRSVKRRAQRAGISVPNDVNIVSLRKLISQGRFFPDESDLTDPNWSHRWWVRGHWRRQYHPSTQSHEWIYIEPHIKGPEDKPIVVKQSAFFMER